MIEYHESGVVAIVMKHGGPTSHAAIIAQALDIPCIIGVDWKRTQLDNVDLVAVDAISGEIVIQPDDEILKEYERRREQERTVRDRKREAGGQPNKMECGTPFVLQANIEFEEELKRLGGYRIEGVGLLRTETLFLQQGYFDSDRQLALYKQILQETGDYPVTIRLLDIGGDKLPGKKVDESNPFLGWRGVRMLLDEEALLIRQLETICLAASEYPGRVRILIPMVSDITEIIEVRNHLEGVVRQLKSQGVSLTEPVPLGVMIEVPALALLADEAALYADFFSIGSNDLTQYTLAADRGNERVNELYDPGHPSVWKLIYNAYQAAVRARIPIGVCGEIAGNPVLAGALLGMGIRELSMNPASIPAVKQVICSQKLPTFRALFDSLHTASGHQEAKMILDRWRERHLNGD